LVKDPGQISSSSEESDQSISHCMVVVERPLPQSEGPSTDSFTPGGPKTVWSSFSYIRYIVSYALRAFREPRVFGSVQNEDIVIRKENIFFSFFIFSLLSYPRSFGIYATLSRANQDNHLILAYYSRFGGVGNNVNNSLGATLRQLSAKFFNSKNI
jgi:hypothetical protein